MPASADLYLSVCIAKQQLSVMQAGQCIKTYPIATAKNGAGQLKGSECTPLGWHRIRAKIGNGQPLNSVFVGRRPTGEIYSPQLRLQYPNRDWILTRILWLGGLEPGKNRYGKVDTTWRYIYIHGGPDETITGIPNSHGCIKMINSDVIELFDLVNTNCKVLIDE